MELHKDKNSVEHGRKFLPAIFNPLSEVIFIMTERVEEVATLSSVMKKQVSNTHSPLLSNQSEGRCDGITKTESINLVELPANSSKSGGHKSSTVGCAKQKVNRAMRIDKYIFIVISPI